MKILLMGPKGCGKGTIGNMLAEYLGIPVISTGQMLRDLPETHPWYKLFHEQMARGVLADQEKLAKLLRAKIAENAYSKGYILDGWFRTMENVKLFEPPIDVAVLLQISPETSVKRLSSRRTCSNCGAVYNIYSVPPKVEGICDKCGGKLIQREDDTEEAILKRLKIYNEDTREVLEYLRRKCLLKEVSAEGLPAEVFTTVKTVLGI